MRVAILVADLFGPGAVGWVARAEAEAMARADHEVFCLSASDGQLQDVTVVPVRQRKTRKQPIRHLVAQGSFSLGAARMLLRLPQIDLIVSHGGPYCLAAALAARRYKAVTVYVVHTLIWELASRNPYPRLPTLLFHFADRYGLTRMSYTLSVSEYMRSVAVHHGADPRRAHVRRNPVDTMRFHPGDGTKDIDILFVGRLSPEKGVDVLMDAIAALPPLRVVVVGDGRLRGVLEEQACGRAEFRGAVDRNELPDLYRRAKVCVVPSLAEAFPLVVLEALASGTPVVGSATGGIPEIIADGRNGWLVRPGDSGALTDALRYAIETELAGMAEAARNSVERESLDLFYARVPQQYEALVGAAA